jgi:L-arabinose isomerase
MTKVGLFGIGLDTYWSQFQGLLDNLKGYQKYINDKISQFDLEVVDVGMRNFRNRTCGKNFGCVGYVGKKS